ncbi:alpha/beta hydrolase [Paracoccus sp. T5]|uniref:alpha/beta hydrolase n=1 Tax=Paracoccus sp. T5 TaxID=3402161 RepID=UPI003AE6D57B
MIQRNLAIATLGMWIIGAAAQAEPLTDRMQIQVWPDTPVGSATFEEPQEIRERSEDPAVKDRAAFNITTPDLMVYLPENPNGSAMLVTPGGAYARVVYDKEADEIAPALNEAGITVFRLLYRLPGGGQATNAPIADAQRAMRLIRTNADEWGLDASRVGVLGFSAGGHLAAWLAAAPTLDAYEPVDETDTASARPDFLALGYPVISMEEGITHPQSREELLGTAPDDATVNAHSIDKLVTAEMPPTFIFGANDDDAVIPENTFRLVAALREAGVPVELHQFEQGGHGFSLRMVRDMPAETWPDLLVEWLGSKGMLD